MDRKKDMKKRVYPWSQIKDPWKNEKEYARKFIIWPELEKQGFSQCEETEDKYLLKAINSLMDILDEEQGSKFLIVSNDSDFLDAISFTLPPTYSLTYQNTIIALDGARLDSVLSYTSKKPFVDPENSLLYKSNMLFFKGILDGPPSERQRKWDIGIFYRLIESMQKRKRAVVGTYYVSSWSKDELEEITRKAETTYNLTLARNLFSNIDIYLFMRDSLNKKRRLSKLG